jgi:hypothetical protein
VQHSPKVSDESTFACTAGTSTAYEAVYFGFPGPLTACLNSNSNRSIGVLEFRKRLQGFPRGAGEYHLLVAHLKGTVWRQPYGRKQLKPSGNIAQTIRRAL